jgi:hypothetical protein
LVKVEIEEGKSVVPDILSEDAETIRRIFGVITQPVAAV